MEDPQEYCQEEVENAVSQTKRFRKELDAVLQRLKNASGVNIPVSDLNPLGVRSSRERSLAITKVQEAIMWLGMDLKAQSEEGASGCDNPYPQSYNPASQQIEPTADGLKL
jgi:hypothetical protein